MNIVETTLPGVLIFEPEVYGDARGFFVETFREEWLRQAKLGVKFIQDNQSRSRKGVLRGLHYQTEHTQGKLVRVSRGAVFDVVVDVRRGSPHFGHWASAVLDDISHRQLYVPPGFAHGFCVLSEEVDFAYKCTDYWHPASETGILWNDPEIGIQWPDISQEWSLSDKDRVLPTLSAQTRLLPY
jgi:dTDP-4-dehydrorhamnose 3,5-epimerase